ncbi:hypothetical protein N431DRAFT_396571 [Stipitochalara longipes BDJ]|nr:hypothetical protein N431DRAFT_396571 [Stipitochalara longipes BDJ]
MPTDNTPKPNPSLPRKGMRKGTRSCYECRIRKIRCIFAKDATVCEGCTSRGKKCTEQKRELLQEAALDNRESLRARIARLEAVIQASNIDIDGPSVAPRDAQFARVRTESSSSSSVSDSRATSILSHNTSISIDKDSPQSIDPIVTLFDNAIWRRRSSDSAQERTFMVNEAVNPAATTKNNRTREALVSSLIPSELLGMILSATCSWWHTWRPLGAWLSRSMGDKEATTLQDFVIWAFDSPNPSIVGLALLCIAVCLQQLDTRVHQYIVRQLPRLPGELFQEYFEKVDRLILNDSDYASTKEGIEATVLSAKIYMNLGLNKKCWVLLHRSIAHSQLLSFHRPERLFANETEIERQRRVKSWLSLCSADVYTSLILGLPYAADGRTIPVTESGHSATSSFQHYLIQLSAKLIDRNQMGLSLSVSRTEEIQKELEVATQHLDESFWDSPTALTSGKITRQEYLEQLSAQLWFYQLLVLLHMPLMIYSVEDAQLEKHRTSCLAASRNLLEVYHTMRSDSHSAFSMVKVIDYQAFVCSALLVLGLLGYGGSGDQLVTQEKDRYLLGQTIATLRQAAGTVNNPMASQAVQGLESLMFLDQGGCASRTDGSCELGGQARIVVPQIGTITISPGEYYTSSSSGCKPPGKHLPVFALSRDIFQGASSQASQVPPLQSNAGFDGDQVNGIEFGDNLHPELHSIEFDWTSAITPNFEDDWAWLNDLNY